MLRKLLLGSALFAAASFAAIGAASAAATDSWTGFYLGVNAGYGGDKFEYPVKGSFTGPVTLDLNAKASLNSSGFLGGGQVGYNYEFPGHWVFGVEADIDASSIEGKVSADGSLTGTVSGTADIKAGSTLGYLGTARARLGYDWGRFMLFGAGGLAYGNVDSKFDVNVMSGSSTLFAATASKSSTRTGWTLGAGFEYVVSDNLTIRTEYLYADLGSYNLISTPFSIMGGSGNIKLDAATTVNVVRIGLNYKLD